MSDVYYSLVKVQKPYLYLNGMHRVV